MFNVTRTVPITDVKEGFQLELCELQSNQNLLVKSNIPIALYRSFSEFTSIWIASGINVREFLRMKTIKSKETNLLTQTSLKSCFLLALTSVDINTKELANRT